MLNREEVITEVSNICKNYTDILGKVILFGSVARNEIKETSDIDLYIESSNLKLTTCKLLTSKRYDEFHSALYSLYDDISYDLLTYGGIRDTTAVKKTPLWEQIQKDGVILYDKGTKEI